MNPKIKIYVNRRMVIPKTVKIIRLIVIFKNVNPLKNK